jgi:transcriptional regulator with XRE-family HTH domain
MSNHPIKTYREAQTPKMSQTRLAELLGVSRMTVLRWETGERPIALDKITDIAAKTGIPTRELRPDLTEMFGGAS